MKFITWILRLDIKFFGLVMLLIMACAALSGNMRALYQEHVRLEQQLQNTLTANNKLALERELQQATLKQAQEALEKHETLQANYEELKGEYKEVKKESLRQRSNVRKVQKKLNKLEQELPLKKHILKLKPVISRELLDTYSDAIQTEAMNYDVPPALVACIIKYESDYNPKATGPVIANGVRCKGSMQIHPAVHKKRMRKHGIAPSEVYEIGNNIKLGVEIFREFYDITKNTRKALRFYVGGHNPKYVKNIMACYASSKIDRAPKFF